MSNVMAGAPSSRGRGPRYLLVTCYAVGGLVGAILLALLILLAVDGHPLPLLAAAVGAILPFPLRGTAYLLGFPHPVKGRIQSTGAYIEVRKKLLADYFEMGIRFVPGLFGRNWERRYSDTFRLLLAPLVIWYRLFLLRIQLILGSPRAPMSEPMVTTKNARTSEKPSAAISRLESLIGSSRAGLLATHLATDYALALDVLLPTPFSGIWSQLSAQIDLDVLVTELEVLRIVMRIYASKPEDDLAIAEIAHAQLAAAEGNGPLAISHLTRAGKLAFDIATAIGSSSVMTIIQKAGIVPRQLESAAKNSAVTPSGATYKQGTLSVGELQEEIDRLWHELLTGRLDAEITTEGFDREALVRIGERPIVVQVGAKRIDLSSASIVVTFASAASPRMLEDLWRKIIFPLIKRRWGEDSIGAETGLDGY